MTPCIGMKGKGLTLVVPQAAGDLKGRGFSRAVKGLTGTAALAAQVSSQN